MHRRPICLQLVVVVILVAACSPGPAPRTTALEDDAVTVASFEFSESELLGELYAQALEARGIRVVRQLAIGPRELVGPALERGLVELIPEYAGSLLTSLTGGKVASPDLATVRHAVEGALRDRDIVVLDSARAQNRNMFAVSEERSRGLGLLAVSDLRRVETLVLGGPPECPTRPLCLPGLEQVYGLEVSEFVPLDGSGPLTAEALERELVNVALMFSTSPLVDEHDLVLLRDDGRLQPAEHITPVVHRAVLDRFGARLREAVDAVSHELSTTDLRALNAAVELHGVAPSEAARAWLAAHDLGPPEE